MILVSTFDPHISRSLERHLTTCGLPFRQVTPAVFLRPALAATAACVCSRTFARTPPLLPTVVICHGARVRDVAWTRRPLTAVFLRRDRLTTESLLNAIVRAQLGGDPGPVTAMFPGVPLRVVGAFLVAPHHLNRLRDLSLALGLSRHASQRLIRKMGSSRFEHWRTRMRAAAWRWLKDGGLERGPIMRYLGITDLANFRRACRRAGCLPPWHPQIRGGGGERDGTRDGVAPASAPGGDEVSASRT